VAPRRATYLGVTTGSKMPVDGVLGTLNMEAWPVVSNARLLYMGQAGFDSVARKVLLAWSSSAGSIDATGLSGIAVAAAAYASMACLARLRSIPADTGVTVSAINAGDGPAYYQGAIAIDRWV